MVSRYSVVQPRLGVVGWIKSPTVMTRSGSPSWCLVPHATPLGLVMATVFRWVGENLCCPQCDRRNRKRKRLTFGRQSEGPTSAIGMESTGVEDHLVILREQSIPKGPQHQYGSNEHAVQYAEVALGLEIRRKGCVIRHQWTIFRLKLEVTQAQCHPRFMVEA